MKKRIILASLFVVFAILFSFSFAFALAEQNLSEKQIAEICIQESIEIMEFLEAENFSIQRVNDTISEAKLFFESQMALETSGRFSDYTRVLLSCESIKTIKELAIESRDSLRAVENFYFITFEGREVEEVETIFTNIRREITNERYELVEPLIVSAYDEIIRIQSLASTLNVFYDATTRGLKRFFRENWPFILVSIFALIVAFFVLKKPILRLHFKRKILFQEYRKKSLKNMMTKNQDLYFNKGKMSEEAFTIKSKKLVELIRDVDRLIAIYKEQLHSVETGKTIKKNINDRNIVKHKKKTKK